MYATRPPGSAFRCLRTEDRTLSFHPTIDAELQIDQVQAADDNEAIVVVRCLRGPVRLGARFRQFRDPVRPTDLELTQILFYRRLVDELDTAHTALVTLRGAGTRDLRPGNIASGWQIIQGTNPSA